MLSALPGGNLGRRHGSPPAAVVTLHGWRRTSGDFDAVLAGLDAAAPDLPGFGAAAPPPTAWGAADYAESVLPLCEEDGPVVLLGHSFGGKVAVVLAARHPQRVRGLVLTGVPLMRPASSSAPQPSWSYRAARAMHRLHLLSDERMEARRRRSGSADYQAATGVMRDVLVRSLAETGDGTYRRALTEVACPVELVWGEHDTAAPLGIAEEALTHVSDGRLTVVPGGSHFVPTEAPAVLRAALDRMSALTA
ncbi:MAG TPA: alpha/beta hydrolase [Acidimicrobiales bacterium]|nr:alpha/beta hydrolase [Acidimicrobiales bacterium]